MLPAAKLVAPEGHEMYDFSKPEKFGRGAWLRFLIDSKHAESPEERKLICKQIRRFCLHCKCKQCGGHCADYITNNPPETCTKSNDHLFEWFVTFMNAVNMRLGKMIYDRDLMHKLFESPQSGMCSTDCGNDPVKLVKQPTSVNTVGPTARINTYDDKPQPTPTSAVSPTARINTYGRRTIRSAATPGIRVVTKPI